MRKIFYFWALAAVFFMALPGLARAIERKTFVIESVKNLEFKVEVVKKRKDMEKGLMYREGLGKFEGMYFDFGEKEKERFMWMKNTLLSLDMLFIEKGGKIINIKHDATPMSKEKIRSGGKIIAIVEIRGGLAKELGIKIGDQTYLK